MQPPNLGLIDQIRNDLLRCKVELLLERKASYDEKFSRAQSQVDRVRKLLDHLFGDSLDKWTYEIKLLGIDFLPVLEFNDEPIGSLGYRDPFDPDRLVSLQESEKLNNAIDQFVSLLDELAITIAAPPPLVSTEPSGTLTETTEAAPPVYASTQIFIVHGQDEEIKQAAARAIEKLGFEPIILHEQANRGRTIMEKFLEYTQVGFAVVLLTPDDLARPVSSTAELKFRARQNVILELGYFLGKLGRDRVFVLYREHDNFEIPSDFSGVLYTPYDVVGRWQFALAKELKACGYSIDVNLLL